ncbi:ATP-binding protein [Flavobacterium sp. LS1R47]|uniref:ATP-binding protein n=1 Tax=Flavobacterium frigoritolerans TaxID=2987686 RepID=A0A9X2ZMK1_9FLAO|nr:ATP-binding protein [Flavobacterium frigoritolerans]MCV9933545.1 ATP-binding protein [Flavobacterium frigoritolerans]
MIISIFLRHFKIYKGINYLPISEGVGFSSIIGENGCGKSSILEALDFCFNKKGATDWPINNEAKSDGISGDNFPFIVPVFLIHKNKLRKENKPDLEQYNNAKSLSDFLWRTTIKAKGKFYDDFYKHRDELSNIYDPEEYLLLFVGKKYNDPGVYFGSFHNQLTFINDKPHETYEDAELQKFFKGFYEYINSHYSYIYIPVETDVQTYTKLETQDMQKLMDKNIQREIEKAITSKTINQINKDLDKFVKEIEEVLEIYHYKGHFKNNLTMPDLVSKIIEAYFSIKVLNKKVENSKSIPVTELSSGEKRKALIDVAYSFLRKNNDRESNIILAIDEPEASLHISNCYEQFDKLLRISKDNHQILVSTHWYGFLPIITNGSATAVTKNAKNEVTFKFLNLYNYRENILHSRKLHKGPLPIDYNIKSYNDLVQSIIISVMQDNAYYWIVCEGQSEKIYFDHYFKSEIDQKNLRILPVGGFKEVKKIYSYLTTPIKDPDYKVIGKVYCLIDTDKERIEVSEYSKDKNLLFERLVIRKNESILVEVNNVLMNPPTEIEDCLDPTIFYHALQEFSNDYQTLWDLFAKKKQELEEKYSADFFDLTKKEKEIIKSFFDDHEGFNKILFAKKYVELAEKPFFKELNKLDWIEEIKIKLYK